MGSGEGTMSVFAKRLKSGKSWCEDGILLIYKVFALCFLHKIDRILIIKFPHALYMLI